MRHPRPSDSSAPRPAPSHAPRRARRASVSFGSLAAILGGTALLVLIAKAATSKGDLPIVDLSVNSGTVAGSDTAPQQAPTAEQAIGAMKVRDLSGKDIPLVTKGEPAIIMVSSVTCSFCKKALKDLGMLSAGRPLPRLKLLTLEGASEGIPMLAKEKITGAQLIGPAGSKDQVLLTFRYPGTPTFVAVDRNGRVVATMPGYPMLEVMKGWYAVMVGDQDVP
ncbi:MAG: hypothetical protein IT353_20010 [Gemmatimonadaceae bacterium]|nr:hypothetical protein [Gemmatimonadaceae bacterium]